MKEQVHSIPIAQLYPFKNQSFQVKDDEATQKLADSIRKHGVLIPACPATSGWRIWATVRSSEAPGKSAGWIGNHTGDHSGVGR